MEGTEIDFASEEIKSMLGMGALCARGSWGHGMPCPYNAGDACSCCEILLLDVLIQAPGLLFADVYRFFIGASYGVHKLLSDAPHWSSTGH